MAEAKGKIKLNAAPKDVWALIGDFNALPKWHPGIAGSVIEKKDGNTYRHLTLGDGAKLTEILEGHDDKEMKYSYAITVSPLPVDDYHSKLKVEADGSGSKVKWKGRFKAKGAGEDDVVKLISGVYEAGLAALKAKFG
jgi:carbon monoxide dehydrogenase subunit G